MRAQKLTPILYTDKVEETITFYTTTLDFVLNASNEEWGWASLHNGEVEVMLSKPNAHASFDRAVFTGSFYFRIADVDTLWEKLKDQCQIEYGIETFEWDMREFAIRDNNGYVLQFGQSAKFETDN